MKAKKASSTHKRGKTLKGGKSMKKVQPLSVEANPLLTPTAANPPAGHTGEIQIDSFSFGVTNTQAVGTGTGAASAGTAPAVSLIKVKP
jgi:hypothetical protein